MDMHQKKQYHWRKHKLRLKVEQYFTKQFSQVPLSFYQEHEAVFFELLIPKKALQDYEIQFDPQWLRIQRQTFNQQPNKHNLHCFFENRAITLLYNNEAKIHGVSSFVHSGAMLAFYGSLSPPERLMLSHHLERVGVKG